VTIKHDAAFKRLIEETEHRLRRREAALPGELHTVRTTYQTIEAFVCKHCRRTTPVDSLERLDVIGAKTYECATCGDKTRITYCG